ncbi:hypothetical protein K9O30_01470 [Clostridium bowmanii]|uniref:hypothetical protein n=1 Tax=Clostridium bowmanii TaxID=132925 RepID=UPI001C0E753B|nr:hypothetical protein [Clostridium bowmanii]MBU3191587.1 hypothetical protein [Clostridium bowmanii]MCA1072428.1 hypothetical protein [Clostridium bowmanii]
MKWKKRIFIWIVVSLSLQCLVLFYVDRYFLATDSKVDSKKVEPNETEKIKNIDITVPASAENILVSYDAKYLSYYENEKLKIVNCKDGTIKDISVDDGCTISFSKWLPDRNRMLLVEKKSYDESSNLVLYHYDVSKGEKVKIKDLAWANTKSEVEDIQLATLTGVIYVKVSSEGERSSIYRIDRMGGMTKADTIPNFVSNISVLRHEDQLIYEGSVYNKIYATGRESSITVEGVDKLTLLGDDDNDNVYLGELKDKLISKIYYGKTADGTEDWKMIELQQPTAIKDLYVSSDGKMYKNDSLKGVLKEISSGTETSYEGKLLQLYTKGLVSLVNNKISFVPFK